MRRLARKTPSPGTAFLLPIAVNERRGHTEPLEQRYRVSFSPSIPRRWPNGRPSRRHFHAGDVVKLPTPRKVTNNTTFFISERLCTALPPVLHLQDSGQTGYLQFQAERQTAMASSPILVRSDVQNLHTGMPELPFFADVETSHFPCACRRLAGGKGPWSVR